MASGSSPPLLGFDSDGKPVLGDLQRSDRDRRPSDSCGTLPVFETPLRNFGEKIRSLRPRPRSTTIGASPADVTVVVAKGRAAAKRELLLEKRRYPSLRGVQPLSGSSLEWDNSGQALQGHTSASRLWSTSTCFDVPVLSPASTMSDPASSNPTNSAANSTAETVVNPLGSRTAPPPPPPGQNSTGPPQQPNAANAEDWPARAREALSLADDLVLPWRGKRMRPAMLNTVHSRAENILQTIRAAYPHCEPVLQVRLGVYRTDLAQLCVDIEQFNIESSTSSGSDGESRERNTGGGPSAHSSPRGHQPPPPPQQSPTTLAFNERTVRYLLDLISDRNLPDVALGSDVDNETLKELHDVKVKEINSLIKDCREATRKYATCVGAIPGLIDRAQTQCERAYEWTRQVLERFRGNQLHLSGNMLAKDVLSVPEFAFYFTRDENTKLAELSFGGMPPEAG